MSSAADNLRDKIAQMRDHMEGRGAGKVHVPLSSAELGRVAAALALSALPLKAPQLTPAEVVKFKAMILRHAATVEFVPAPARTNAEILALSDRIAEHYGFGDTDWLIARLTEFATTKETP